MRATACPCSYNAFLLLRFPFALRFLFHVYVTVFNYQITLKPAGLI